MNIERKNSLARAIIIILLFQIQPERRVRRCSPTNMPVAETRKDSERMETWTGGDLLAVRYKHGNSAYNA